MISSLSNMSPEHQIMAANRRVACMQDSSSNGGFTKVKVALQELGARVFLG